MADGSRHSIYLVPELQYGTTPVSPNLAQIRHTGTTLALTKNTSQSEEIRPDRQIADFRHGTSQVGGDISVEMSFGSFDTLFEAVTMGSWEVDDLLGTSTLKAGTTRRSFSLVRHFSDMSAADKPYHTFNGVEFNTFNMQVSPDAIVKATFSAVGKGMSTSENEPVGSTYTDASDNKVFDAFTGTLKEKGTTIAVVTEIQITLENGLDPRFVIGSQETIQPQVGRSNLSGQITAYFENSTLLDKFINETESSLEFSLHDGAGNEYVFTLPRIVYNGGQPDVSGQGAITLSMPFQALFDTSTGTNIQITKSK